MTRTSGLAMRAGMILAFATLLVAQALAAAPGKAGIASADPRATAAGYEVLQAGGNAFDAAVAVSAALGVVEPQSSGMGGGSFFLLYIAAEDRYVFVDAREIAPAAATRDMYLDEDGNANTRASLNGPLAAGIPGHPAGLAHVTDRYGKLSLAQNLEPAIRLAENGYTPSVRTLLGLRMRRRTAEAWPAFGDVFYPGDEMLEESDLVRQPDLATTLRRFAADGVDGFYRGETARLLVEGTRAAGGIWTLADLEQYKVVEREPVRATYRDMRVISAPPPSSGGIAIANMLNILAGYDIARLDGATRKHVLVEAMRRAYRDRALYLGDPDFVSVPGDRLMHPHYAAGQRASIRLDKATASVSLPGIWPAGAEARQTTHFSVLDADGNRVAVTQTINGWFGAGFMPPGTGVILNNEMDDFAIAPGVPNGFDLLGGFANAVAPGKRPLSSMSPTFLESDRGIAILGTPGGSRIITMVLRSSLAWYEGASAADMVALKRFHHQFYPDRVNYEPGAFTDEEIPGLTERGHQLRESRRAFGNMNVVTWDFDGNVVEAASDPRGLGEGRVY
ncbi:MAG: gamma-glutamyltransferase [Gammaproteobacteria bacterium]|nr:gamma-glutamyltransferase [Gammaproteobacteria bacterium]